MAKKVMLQSAIDTRAEGREKASIIEELRANLSDVSLYEKYELLLSDKDLWALMLVEFSPELAERTQEVSVSEKVGVKEKVQVQIVSKVEKDEQRIREGIAGVLNKAPSQLTDADYKNVNELELTGASIKNIEFLTKLTNLQFLSLSGTQVSNIDALSGLTNLQLLFLDRTQVSDIGALSGLINLQSLYLDGIQVSDIGALSGLKNLQTLSLAGTQVSDIGALSGLKNLQWLSLSSTKVSDEQVDELQKALPELEIRRLSSV
jgi:Leucine-rich repeat (LRR) protein